MSKDKKIASQKPLIPLWQYLLVILIIILPAVGFYGGVKYQQQHDAINTASIISTAIPKTSPDTLVIIRVEDKQDGLPLLIKTITHKTKVTKLYNEIYGLPYIPNGNYNCPREYYAEYTLNFYQYNKQIINATFNPTGCSIVQISNGKARWAALPSGQTFTKNLQQALDLSSHNFYGYPE